MYETAISHTTRKPRHGEENGVNYHYVTESAMKTMNDDGNFVEIVSLFGNQYGIAIESVESVTRGGKVCVLILEVEVDFILHRELKHCANLIWIPDLYTLLRHQ